MCLGISEDNIHYDSKSLLTIKHQVQKIKQNLPENEYANIKELGIFKPQRRTKGGFKKKHIELKHWNLREGIKNLKTMTEQCVKEML